MRSLILFLVIVLGSSLAHAELLAVNVRGLNMRTSPSTSNDNNIIKVLGEGTQLETIEDAGDWVKVRIRGGQIGGGTEGYVWKSYTESFATYDGIDDGNSDAALSGQPQAPMCSCTSCRRSSPFGMRTHPITGRRRLHSGCDMAAPKGTKVYAAAAGIVKLAGVNGGYGKCIDIEHRGEIKDLRGRVRASRGYTTRYGHLWKIHVSRNQRVAKGQLIGEVDSTGSSTGHHLHFEIALAGTGPTNTGGRVNPEDFVRVNDTQTSCSNGNYNTSATAQ